MNRTIDAFFELITRADAAKDTMAVALCKIIGDTEEEITYDQYDYSFEFHSCANDLRVPKEKLPDIWALGFDRFWLNHVDGSETRYCREPRRNSEQGESEVKGEQPKWTPGPWHVSESNEVLDEKSLLVAAEIIGEHAEIYRANARLIAAAPELYEALEMVVAISDRKHDAWDAARAALAKARGASPE